MRESTETFMGRVGKPAAFVTWAISLIASLAALVHEFGGDEVTENVLHERFPSFSDGAPVGWEATTTNLGRGEIELRQDERGATVSVDRAEIKAEGEGAAKLRLRKPIDDDSLERFTVVVKLDTNFPPLVFRPDRKPPASGIDLLVADSADDGSRSF